MARRVLPGHQAGAARRAVGCVGVGLLEQQSVIGHGVQIRGVDGLRARAAKVVPPHVIDVDDDDVRLLIRFYNTDTRGCRVGQQYSKNRLENHVWWDSV